MIGGALREKVREMSLVAIFDPNIAFLTFCLSCLSSIDRPKGLNSELVCQTGAMIGSKIVPTSRTRSLVMADFSFSSFIRTIYQHNSYNSSYQLNISIRSSLYGSLIHYPSDRALNEDNQSIKNDRFYASFHSNGLIIHPPFSQSIPILKQ